MRIGILTLPLHTNYGGILQAYALQIVMERMGHKVVIFDTDKKLDTRIWKHPRTLISRCVNKFIRREHTRIFYERWYNNTYPIISQHIQKFLDKYMHILKTSDFNKLTNSSFDVLIVGSDQVWRPMYFTWMYKKPIYDAYLAFARDWDVKRISYAPSFGTEDWEYSEEQSKRCGELLNLFNVVTVREESGVKLCREHFGVNATHVLDPTLLVDRVDYIKLIENSSTPQSPGNLLCYILDDSNKKTNIIDTIARKKGLVPFYVNSKSINNECPIEERIKPSIESWLRGFYDAELVVTDSFHACVFSIIFNKPFFVIGNKERGMARFESLLIMFGLQDRMIDINNSCFDSKDIDWTLIQTVLEKKRNDSYKILYEALK